MTSTTIYMPSTEPADLSMHKCKRIIAGKAYNTETATRLAGWDVTEDEYPLTHGEHLYQNRFGAFFLYIYADDGPDGPEQGLTPYSPEQAQAWLLKHRSYDLDLFESVFGKVPEAGTSESKFTLRLPDNLRDRIAARAKKNGQSLNAWIIKCLEQCAPPQKSPIKSKVRP